jgi:hypothetical protein
MRPIQVDRDAGDEDGAASDSRARNDAVNGDGDSRHVGHN